jgi:DNA-binding NarL/FixJ family response regulator
MISESTVKFHMNTILRKLKMQTLAQHRNRYDYQTNCSVRKLDKICLILEIEASSE